MNLILALSFAFATAVTTVAAPREVTAPDAIKDKVRITLGQKLNVKFKVEGDRLVEPMKVASSGEDRGTVGIQLQVTDATPFRVRGVPTRPYLVVSNGLEKTLRCRVLARLKGSKEFFEISDGVEPVSPGKNSQKCWESGNLIEEVLLYHFTLSKEPAK